MRAQLRSVSNVIVLLGKMTMRFLLQHRNDSELFSFLIVYIVESTPRSIATAL